MKHNNEYSSKSLKQIHEKVDSADSEEVINTLQLYLHSSNGDCGTGAFWKGRDRTSFCSGSGSSDVIDSDVDLRAQKHSNHQSHPKGNYTKQP